MTAIRSPRYVALLFAALLALFTTRPMPVRAEASFDFFYDTLAPYGEWIEVDSYGMCWRPNDVDRDWAPYADGYWTFTDAGWTWVSYEDFGGIVYHYGRWIFAEDEGWCWVPDYEWGPAWVSWRESDDYIGWAPLPPEARWRRDVGISIWVDRVYDIGPGFYSFCHVRDFGAPVLRPVIIRRTENVTIIRRTVNITNITYNTTYVGGPVIYNSGPNYALINPRCARPVPTLKLVRNVDVGPGHPRSDGRPEHRRSFNPQPVGNQLVVTAPVVAPPSDLAAFKSRAKRNVGVDKVSRGWGMVKNAEIRQELKQEMQRQTKGLTPENAPARRVADTELKVVPPKADPQAPSPQTVSRERRDRGEKKEVPPVATVAPPTASEIPVPEKMTREKGRGIVSPEIPKPTGREPVLKPFRPVTEMERRSNPESAPVVTAPTSPIPVPPTAPPVAREKNRAPRDRDEAPLGVVRVPPVQKMPDARRVEPPTVIPDKRTTDQAESMRRAAEQAEQARQMQRRATDASAQQKQIEDQRQAEMLRQRQQENAAAERQKLQMEQARMARQQAEAAAASQEKQAEGQRQRAAMEAARTQDLERARKQQEQAGEMRRRQQMDQQTAEQQQRRQIEAQQRATEQANRQQIERAAEDQRRSRERNDSAEQARRAQEGQREQMRQQAEAQRQAREVQRVVPPPNAPPQSAPPATDSGRRHKDKDKEKDR